MDTQSDYLAEFIKDLKDFRKEKFVDPIEVSAKILGVEIQKVEFKIIEISGLIEIDFELMDKDNIGYIIDSMRCELCEISDDFIEVYQNGTAVMYITNDGDVLLFTKVK